MPSVRLLSTVAASMGVALENVRLFNETKEALEQQTATAEVLRVISASVTDTQPVFDAIVAACQRLFGGRTVNLLLPKDGMLQRVAVATDGSMAGREVAGQWPLDHDSVAGDCVLSAKVVAVEDRDAVVERYPRTRELAAAIGWRSGLFVPLLRDGAALGAIGIVRADAGPFDDRQIALAQTFADQAVIAIENARLFTETQGGAGAADRQRARAAGHQPLDRRHAAGVRHHPRLLLERCSPARSRPCCCSTTRSSSWCWRRTTARRARCSSATSRGRSATTPFQHALREGAHAALRQRAARRRTRPSRCASIVRAMDFGDCSQVFVPLRWEGRGIGTLIVRARAARRPSPTTRSRCSAASPTRR